MEASPCCSSLHERMSIDCATKHNEHAMLPQNRANFSTHTWVAQRVGHQGNIKQIQAQQASPGVNSPFSNFLCRFAVVDMWVLLICSPPPQNEQELQRSSAHSKERHVCHTGFGNTRRGKDGCHNHAIKVRDMVEYDNWPGSVSLCNVLPALDSQTKEIETKANAQRCPKPASMDRRSITTYVSAQVICISMTPSCRNDPGMMLVYLCCLLDPYAHD